MLRWIWASLKPRAKKLKAKAKKRVASVRIRRSHISGNARMVRNIIRMA